MADVRVDVELTTSLKGVQSELAKVLRPIEQLLQKLSGNPTLELQLTKQGAGLVSKQLEEFARKAGLDQQEAKKLGEAFRVFVADIDRYLRSVRRGELAEAGQRLNSAMKNLQTFLDGVSAWDKQLQAVKLPSLKIFAQRGNQQIIIPQNILKTVETIEKDLNRYFVDRTEREARELRKQLYLRLQTIKSDVRQENFTEAKDSLVALLNELRKSGGLLDSKALEGIRKVLADLRVKSSELVQKTAAEVQRLAKEYLVSSTLPKLAPGVDPDALLRAYAYLGGSREQLLNAFFDTLVLNDQYSNMAAGQTAKGLQQTVSRLVGHIEQTMMQKLMTTEYGRNLLTSADPKAFFEQLSEAYRLLSSQLLNVGPAELKRTAELFQRNAAAAKAKFGVALEDVRGIGLALNAVAEFLEAQFGKSVSILEALTMYAHSNLLNEMAEGNPLAGAYRYGRQRALDSRHEDYLRAFLPGLYQRYRQLAEAGDPRALQFRTGFIANLGTSVDALHGILLNSLANFVSGIGIGAFFGTVYSLAQYVQQMQALNKQLLAYKKILEMRGEEEMAKSVSSLRERLLELAKASGVAVEEIAQLFGTVARNGLSTDGLERLLGVVGRLNTVFGIPFDSLRKDIAEILLQHRQYFLGPDTVARVLEYGGPQADKALNVFNQLIQQTNSAAFSFEELAKAVRYYLDTGKPVKNSFYEIAEAVRYGGSVAEETARQFNKLAQETVDFGQILGRGDEYQENVQRLQKQLGLTISSLGHDILSGFGIGEASTFMATLQAMLAGFLAVVKGIQDLVNAVLNAKMLGPVLQAALAVLTGTGIIAMTVSMFRLLALFATRVIESVTSTLAILRTTNLTTGIGTAINLLVALRANLVKFFASLGAVVATAGTGALNLLRSGGLAALAGGVVSGLGTIGAAIPGIGWIALGATALVGTGIYLATRDAKRRNEEINKSIEASQQTIPSIGRITQTGSTISIFAPDNATDMPTYTIDLEKLRSKDATDKLVAYMLGKLQGADALVYEHVANLMRALNIQDKASLEQYRKQLNDQMIALANAYAKADQARKKAIQEELVKLTAVSNIINQVGNAYVTAAERAMGVMAQDETRQSLDAQFQAKLKENAVRMVAMTDRERVDFQRKLAEEVLKSTLGDKSGKALFAQDIAQSLLTQTLENLRRELSDRLREAESLPTETARNAAKRAAYSWYASQLQAEQAKLKGFFQRVGLDPNLAKRLQGLLYVELREANAQLGTLARQSQDYQRSLNDAAVQARQQLANVLKEAFYGPTSTPSLTLKLLAAAESLLNTTANDAPEKAASVAREVNAYLQSALPVAQEYDRKVQQMLNEFNMAKRTSDPEKRFQNLKLVSQKYLNEYAKSLGSMPGLALQIADQLEGALFKDGGMLSAINSLADSAVKELKRVAERAKQKDYGPFADLGNVIEALIKGVQTLTKVSAMTADFKALSGQYRQLLEDVRLTQVQSLDQAINRTKSTLQNYRKLPNLSPQDKEYIRLLEAHLRNLEERRRLLVELAKVEEALKKAVPGSDEYRQLLTRSTAIKAQLKGIETEAGKRLTDLDTGVQNLEDALTDYVSSLNDAITGLLDSLKDTVKDVSERLKAQRKQLEKTLKSYLKRGTRVSPVEEEAEALKAVLEELGEQQEQVNQLLEALNEVEKVVNSGQTETLKQVLTLLANNQPLPKDASNEVKELYNTLKGRLSSKDAKDLLDHFTQNLQQLLDFIANVKAKLAEQSTDIKEAVQRAEKHGEALKERASLQVETEKLTKDADKLLAEVRASDDPMAYLKDVTEVALQAQKLNDGLADLKERYSDLDTAELERSIEQLMRVPSEFLSIAVEKAIANLPQPSDVLNFTEADLGKVKEALDWLDILDTEIAKAVDPQAKAVLKDLRNKLVDALLRLVRDGKDSLLPLLKERLGPEAVARLEAEFAAKDFEARLAEVGKSPTIEVSSLGDIPELDKQLEEREANLTKLEEELAEMEASSLYRPKWLDEMKRRLAEEKKNLQALREKRNEQEYQLFVRQDNELLNGVKEAIEATDATAEEMLLAGEDISQVLDLYLKTLDGIANLPLRTEEAKAEATKLQQELNSRLVNLLTKSTPEVAKALQKLFGDPLNFLTSVEGFGPVDDPAVRARIIEAVKDELKKNGFDISNVQAEALARALISPAAKAAKTAYEDVVKGLRDIGFSDIVLRLGSDDFAALKDYGPKLEDASNKLSQLVHAAKLLSLFGEKLDDSVRDEFLRFASETLGSVDELPSVLQQLVSEGKLSELAVTDWLKELRNTLQFVRGLLLSLAETLGLSPEQKAALEKQIDDTTKQLDSAIKQNEAKALQLYLRGDLTSEEFSRRIRGKEVLLGAQSLTEFGQLADGLVQAYRKLVQVHGLSETAVRSRLISQLSAAASLDDRSLVKLVAPDLSESELNAFLNSQVAEERLQALRAAIKRAINDLQEEAQRELEQMIDGLVNSLRDALANLFTSIFTIPVQMLRAWREQQKRLQEMRFELRLATSDVEYWQQKYDEAVKTYGVLSDEARKYAEKVAEAKRAHEELNERIKETENSAKSLFSYLLDAIAQFLEALAQAIIQQAAFRAATWLVDTTIGAISSGSGSGTTSAPPAGTIAPQSVSTGQPGSGGSLTPQAANVQPQEQAAAAANAASGLVSGIISVGSAVGTTVLSEVIASLGVAAPLAGLVAGLVVSAAAGWVADIADRVFNPKYYTYTLGTKGRFDNIPIPVRLEQPVNVNVQVQAEMDRNKIAKETVDKLVRELVHKGV